MGPQAPQRLSVPASCGRCHSSPGFCTTGRREQHSYGESRERAADERGYKAHSTGARVGGRIPFAAEVPLFVHHQIPVAVSECVTRPVRGVEATEGGSCDSVVTSVRPYRIRLSVALIREVARPLPCRRRSFCTADGFGAILWRPSGIGSRNVAFIATRRHPFAGMPVCAITSRCGPLLCGICLPCRGCDIGPA